jgi:hypothetical protein
MSNEERENWKKIKEALEEADKTECYFYRRAVAISEGGEDLLEYK